VQGARGGCQLSSTHSRGLAPLLYVDQDHRRPKTYSCPAPWLYYGNPFPKLMRGRSRGGAGGIPLYSREYPKNLSRKQIYTHSHVVLWPIAHTVGHYVRRSACFAHHTIKSHVTHARSRRPNHMQNQPGSGGGTAGRQAAGLARQDEIRRRAGDRREAELPLYMALGTGN
jgi:hypothetical protein